jgi:hypothetical protein
MMIIKLHKIHFMAMVYKTDFEHENDKRGRNKVKLDHVNVKYTKTTTTYYKNDNVVRSKQSKLNVPYVKQLATSQTATAVCANKKRPSAKSDKTKKLTSRSAKKEEIELRFLLQDHRAKQIERSMKMTIHHHGKIDLTNDDMMRNNVSASSSSPCPSSMAATNPKNISHGH